MAAISYVIGIYEEWLLRSSLDLKNNGNHNIIPYITDFDNEKVIVKSTMFGSLKT